ncbi:unnamed protein product [Caenorhabditis auriculariae]|uniref:Uncharacterized protein n=1 Tax=Caenorhabditis auriculariae TaxID=2777116 RepID=A0A8S1GZF6_9PELO|nr:unnamed protein product [Caenorhabditis auriculariae]
MEHTDSQPGNFSGRKVPSTIEAIIEKTVEPTSVDLPENWKSLSFPFDQNDLDDGFCSSYGEDPTFQSEFRNNSPCELAINCRKRASDLDLAGSSPREQEFSAVIGQALASGLTDDHTDWIPVERPSAPLESVVIFDDEDKVFIHPLYSDSAPTDLPLFNVQLFDGFAMDFLDDLHPVTIRPITANDFEQCIKPVQHDFRFGAQIRPDVRKMTRDITIEDFASSAPLTIVAQVADSKCDYICGFACGRVVENLDGKSLFHLRALVVSKSYRRKHIATKLLSVFSQLAYRFNCDSIAYGHLPQHNEPLRRMLTYLHFRMKSYPVSNDIQGTPYVRQITTRPPNASCKNPLSENDQRAAFIVSHPPRKNIVYQNTLDQILVEGLAIPRRDYVKICAMVNTNNKPGTLTRRMKIVAEQVRKHIISDGFLQNTIWVADGKVIDFESVQMKLTPPVAPCDVETLLSQRKSSVIYSISAKRSSKGIYEFPSDDLEITRLMKERAENLNYDSYERAPSYLRDICNFFQDDYVFIIRKYRIFSADEVESRWDAEKFSGKLGQEACIWRKKSNGSQSTERSLGWETRNSIRILKNISCEEKGSFFNELTAQNRLSHLLNINSIGKESSKVVKRIVPPPPDHFIKPKLIVKILKANIEPSVEPLFGWMAVYDIARHNKVTENFYFCVSDDEKLSLLGANRPNSLNKCLRAAFNVSACPSNLYLVICIEKVLEPCEPAEACDRYTGRKDDKNLDKLSIQAATYCRRLGAYRMPLGIQFVDLQRLASGNVHLLKPDPMSMSSCTLASGATIVAGNDNTDDRGSIASADRVTLSSVASTLRRFGSGTSASAMIKNRTPTLKRKQQPLQPCVEEDEDPIESVDELPVYVMTFQQFFKQESNRISENEIIRMCHEHRNHNGRMSKKSFFFDLDLQIGGRNKIVCSDLEEATPDLDKDADTQECMEIDESCQSGFTSYTTHTNFLYIYPKSVNWPNRPGSSRNISVKIELQDPNGRALPVFFSRGASSSGPFESSVRTSVHYHHRNPNYNDEYKVAIPLDLNKNHHLFFTFYHIACKGTDNATVENIIGYTWLPLFNEAKSWIESGRFELPVSIEKPMKLDSDNGYTNLKWIDGRKPIFDIQLNVISSVYPQDMKLSHFFTAVSSLNSTDANEKPASEQELIEALNNLPKVAPSRISAFLHYILGRIVSLIANPPYTEALSAACFDCLTILVKLASRVLQGDVDNLDRSLALLSFITHLKIASIEMRPYSNKRATERPQIAQAEKTALEQMIENEEKTRYVSPTAPMLNLRIHDQFVAIWLKASPSAKENAFSHCWFYLELLVKCSSEYINMTGGMYGSRKTRFPKTYMENVQNVIELASFEIVGRFLRNKIDDASSISKSIAFFIRDMFTLMDRTFVMQVLHKHVKFMTETIRSWTGVKARKLMELKMEFLVIVCSHEHYLTLNIPVEPIISRSMSQTSVAAPLPSSLSPAKSSSDLDDSWRLGSTNRSQHFIVGLLLTDLHDCLANVNMGLSGKAIENINTMIRTHELDSRVRDSGSVSNIASMYKPLVRIVVDYRKTFYTKPSRCSDEGLKEVANDYTSKNSTPSKTMSTPTSLGVVQTRTLICCMFWVLRNIKKAELCQWISSLDSEQVGHLLHVMRYSINIFEHVEVKNIEKKPGPKPRNERKLTSESQASDDLADNNLDDVEMESVRWRSSTRTPRNRDSTSDSCFGVYLSVSEVAVASEIGLCVSEIIDTILLVASKPESSLFGVLPIAFAVLVQGLSCNLPEQVLEAFLALQMKFVEQMSKLILEQQPELCDQLCRQLLRLCSSTDLHNICVLASLNLYQLLRENFRLAKELRQAKVFTSTAMAALFSGSDGELMKDENLRKSVKFINDLASEDDSIEPDLKPAFLTQVDDVTSNLQTILQSTIGLREHANDYEMTIDLMCQLVDGYANNPDLRITWLLNMAERHEQQKRLCEAALCCLRACALSAEYLDTRQLSVPHYPINAATFSKISEHVLKESRINENNNDVTVGSLHFSEAGLIKLMEKTFTLLEKANVFELLFPLSEILAKFYHVKNSYSRIASIHRRLTSAAENIADSTQFFENQSDAWVSPVSRADRRCFGTFFRVAFYGHLFGDLNEQEFIYKESEFTKLNEISTRIKDLYRNKLGPDVVEIVKDSNPRKSKDLDPNKAYIQITFAEVYLSDDEKMERPTYFQRRNRVNRFMYETPYNLDGNPRGELKSQFKRKTIMTVEEFFPNIKTRIRINDKHIINCTPIEVAIEDIEKKTKELAEVIEFRNFKMLSMVLQGSVNPTVHQGPLGIAEAFLENVVTDEHGRPMDRLQNRLRLAFRHLQHRVQEAVQLSGEMATLEQKEYQANVEKGYKLFVENMKPYLSRDKTEVTFSEFGQATVV